MVFMTGVSFSGYFDVLCIGDDGHLELETHCMSNCSDTEKNCENILPDDNNEEHSECSNCSDIELDQIHWSKRQQKVNLTEIFKINSVTSANIGHLLPISGQEIKSLYRGYSIYGNILSILDKSTAVLRC